METITQGFAQRMLSQRRQILISFRQLPQAVVLLKRRLKGDAAIAQPRYK